MMSRAATTEMLGMTHDRDRKVEDQKVANNSYWDDAPL